MTEERNSGFWTMASALFGCFAVLKGLRVPGVWAVSQLQITYEHGFVKRGLLGQMLHLAHLRSRHAVDAFCMLELLLLLGLLACFTWQSRLLSAARNPALVAAFAGSYCMTFLAHLVGYTDVLLYALALAVVLVRKPRHRFLIALPVCLAAPLLHEGFLLSALPVILFSFIADNALRLADTRKYAGLLAGASLLVACALSLEPSLRPGALAEFKRDTLTHAAYPINPDVFDVLGMSLRMNLRLNYEVVRHNWWWWAELVVGLLTLGPLLALLIYTANCLAPGKQRLFLATSLTPLALNVIGWDNVRWLALCALTAYINLGLLSRSSEWGGKRRFDQRSGQRSEQAAVLVLGLGLASGHGLMDGQKINPYPFFPPSIRPAVIRHDGHFGDIL